MAPAQSGFFSGTLLREVTHSTRQWAQGFASLAGQSEPLKADCLSVTLSMPVVVGGAYEYETPQMVSQIKKRKRAQQF
jgi:hypothetical protein